MASAFVEREVDRDVVPNSTYVIAFLFALPFAMASTVMADDYGYPEKYYNRGWSFSPQAVTATPFVHRTATIVRPVRNYPWTDMSDPYGGYDPNSPEGNRAFWDYMDRY